MTRQLRDDDFEALLGRALEARPAPEGLRRRLTRQMPMRPHWIALLFSPVRLAACAGIVSLGLGFAVGAGSSAVAEDADAALVATLYAASDVGDF